MTAAFGTFLGTLLMVQGVPTLGQMVGSFIAFGLLGHAWGRKPPEFWFEGASLGAVAGLLEGLARSGLTPFLLRPFHGKSPHFHDFSVYLTLFIIYRLGRRAAHYRGWLTGLAALLAWSLAERLTGPGLTKALAGGPYELATEALAMGVRAAAGGAAVAAFLVPFCEDPDLPPEARPDAGDRQFRNYRR